MKLLIIEDEPLAGNYLRDCLLKINPLIQHIQLCPSVENAVHLLGNTQDFDLIFSDIQLGDGLSFDIFLTVATAIPIVFTTAYNEYALKAFEVNSIDYLLKPVSLPALKKALNKHAVLTTRAANGPGTDFDTLKQMVVGEYKSRFLVKTGNAIASVKVEEIAFIVAEDGIVLLTTDQGKRHPVEYSLDQLELLLDPKQYFRINRQCIVGIDHIQKASPHFNGRYKVNVHHLQEEAGLISRDRVSDFKLWLGK